MQGYNCIMIFSPDGKRLLFCKRTKNPYKGLYNLVGGKIEENENGFEAAYRELKEETGIDANKIQLYHMMDFTYYNQDCYVEIYVGQLKEETLLYEEAHPLEWLSVDENYFDSSRFAGEGNIGHMVNQARIYGMGQKQESLQKPLTKAMNPNVKCIGVDGCKGGWITAISNQGDLKIEKFTSIDDIVNRYPNFDEFIIDMVIGLPNAIWMIL